MAQLTDDCFAFGGRLIPLDEALAALAPQFSPPQARADSDHLSGDDGGDDTAQDSGEVVHLTAALGRVAAADVLAPRSVPPHDNSAVDGYAVRFADLQAEGETRLPLHGYAAAGDPPQALPLGTARRILTGAALPPGADTVFMDEDVSLQTTEVDADTNTEANADTNTEANADTNTEADADPQAKAEAVLLPAGLKPGANARKAGEDIAEGDLVLAAGERLNAAHIGLLASLGLQTLRLRPRLRVALFSTGNEIREPGNVLEPGQVYDANRFALRGLLEQAGAEVLDLGILHDDAVVIETALARAAAQADLILTSGGVSAGEHDLVRQVLEARGGLLFWRLAVKPGRPIALGQLDGVPMIGLPGNPAAALVMFFVAVLPLLRRREGARWRAPLALPVTLDFSHRKKADRVEYIRVQVRATLEGRLVARKFPREGAGILSSMAWADGLVALEPERLEVQPGDTGLFTAFTGSLTA